MFLGMWLLLAVAVGILANNRGRSGVGWMLIAAILSPLLGFIFLLVTKDLSKTGAGGAEQTCTTHLKCPACAEWVLPAAHVCKHCGGTLTPQPLLNEQQGKTKSRLEEKKKHDIAVGITVVFSLFLAGFVLKQCAS